MTISCWEQAALPDQRLMVADGQEPDTRRRPIFAAAKQVALPRFYICQDSISAKILSWQSVCQDSILAERHQDLS